MNENTNMLVLLLTQLVEWNGVHMGGDVEEDLRNVGTANFALVEGRPLTNIIRATEVTARVYGSVRAFYDLGLIEALPAPAEGEVRVHGERAEQLLRLVELWRAGDEAMVAKVTNRRAAPIVFEFDEDECVPPAPTVVRDALLLVGIDIPLDIFEERTGWTCAEALEWARKAHLNASDGTVEVPPCPEWVAVWRKS
jgi:hypothetical protein